MTSEDVRRVSITFKRDNTSFKAIDERDENDMRSAVLSLSRSLTPKFIKAMQISITQPSKPLNLRPVFLKLQKKQSEGPPAKQQLTQGFNELLRTSNMFTTNTKRKDDIEKVKISLDCASGLKSMKLANPIANELISKFSASVDNRNRRPHSISVSKLSLESPIQNPKLLLKEDQEKSLGTVSKSTKLHTQITWTPILQSANILISAHPKGSPPSSPLKPILKLGSRLQSPGLSNKSAVDSNKQNSPLKKVKFSKYRTKLVFERDEPHKSTV